MTQAETTAAPVEVEATSAGPEQAESAELRSDAGPAIEPEAQTPSSAVVPVAGSLRQETERPSFWRRISLRRRGVSSPSYEDRSLARLGEIETRMHESEETLSQRIAELDQRFSEVWEVEEQLSQLMDLQTSVSELGEQQQSVVTAIADLGRRTRLLSWLMLTATAALIANLLLG